MMVSSCAMEPATSKNGLAMPAMFGTASDRAASGLNHPWPHWMKTGVYLAILKSDERSRFEDQLVLDGADVSCFASASDLWQHFQSREAASEICRGQRPR
jgi:hypothetical protein